MAQIYRKSTLEKLSSPDQLDKMIVIVRPSFWIAALGSALIIAVALIWSIFGRLPDKIEADGIYMDEAGVRAVTAPAGGIVSEVLVRSGDKIELGQAIARLDAADAQKQLETLAVRRDGVDAVTFDSEDDVATSDNKALLDLKSQKLSGGANLTTNRALLQAQKRELAERERETQQAKEALEEAKQIYYDSMRITSTTRRQVEYQDASTEYQEAKQHYAEARNVELSAQENLQALTDQRTSTAAALAAAKVPASGTDYTDEQREEIASLEAQIASLDRQISAAKKDYQAAQAEALKAERVYDDAENDYEKSERKYISAANLQSADQAENSRAGTDYNIAMNDYTSALNQQSSLRGNVIQLQAQVNAEEINLASQNTMLMLQFNNAKSAVLEQLDQEIDRYARQLEEATIRATTAGYLSALDIAEGNVIQQGGTVCRISAEEDAQRIIICYVPVSKGRKLSAGMRAEIYPSTVNRQEYGHMEGTVLEVAEFVTSQQEIQNQLGDALMVQSFTQNGPVVAVRIDLRADPQTASGYWWSSKKGADLMISDGTMVSCDIVTAEKAPISMLIPFLKEKLTIRPADSSASR